MRERSSTLLIDGDNRSDQLGLDQVRTYHLEHAVPVLQRSADMEFLALFQFLPCRHIDARVDEDDDLYCQHSIRCIQDESLFRLRHDAGYIGHDEREQMRLRHHVGARECLLQRRDLGEVEKRLWETEERFVPGGDPHPFQAIEDRPLSGL